MSLATPEASARTGYAINPLDRLSERRDDPAHVAGLMEHPSTRFVVVGRDKPILRLTGAGYEALFTREEAHGLGALRETVLLGRDSERAYFAQLLADEALVVREQPDEGALVDTNQLVVPGRPDLIVHDLRAVAVEGLLAPERIGLLGQAKSVLYWHARHRFCSACGVRSEVSSAGWRRDCPACRAMHFPRTDPVVIMLAVRGDSCLMGRQPRFNKGMYSALAGFLEPGETIEGAVRREIREESAIQVGRVAYHASQPWPFPASIMIGCIAEAVSHEIEIDRAELEDCRWFSRAEVKAMFEGRHPDGLLAPNPIAIAHRLVRDWADGAAPQF
ncbi:MAG: hypothetical protein JWN93_1753 [Hyphomicrobiales bacterium]|nr:hypothetical protein [Hyphomicrobiales bacterium]